VPPKKRATEVRFLRTSVSWLYKLELTPTRAPAQPIRGDTAKYRRGNRSTDSAVGIAGTGAPAAILLLRAALSPGIRPHGLGLPGRLTRPLARRRILGFSRAIPALRIALLAGTSRLPTSALPGLSGAGSRAGALARIALTGIALAGIALRITH
jgi:hypothetical protein